MLIISLCLNIFCVIIIFLCIFFEEVLLVFETQDPNAEWCTKFAAAVQSTIQCTVSSKMRKKELLPRHHWMVFSRG